MVEGIWRSLTVRVGGTGNHAAGEDHDDCSSLGAMSKAKRSVGNAGGGSCVDDMTYATLRLACSSFLSTDNSAFVDNVMHILGKPRVMRCA